MLLYLAFERLVYGSMFSPSGAEAILRDQVSGRIGPPTDTKMTPNGHVTDPRRRKAMLLFSAPECGAYYTDHVSWRIRYVPILGLWAVSICFYDFASESEDYPTRSAVRPDRTPNRYEKYT